MLCIVSHHAKFWILLCSKLDPKRTKRISLFPRKHHGMDGIGSSNFNSGNSTLSHASASLASGIIFCRTLLNYGRSTGRAFKNRFTAKIHLARKNVSLPATIFLRAAISLSLTHSTIKEALTWFQIYSQDDIYLNV